MTLRTGHVFEGKGVVFNPDGSVAHEGDWELNALHDAGEQSMLNVYLKEQSNVAKHLGLLNDATVAETDGTMSAVTESKTAGTGGYDRQQIANTDWTDDGLIGGDYRFTAAEKTFGPITTATLTATHVSVSTTSTGAGLLLFTVGLTGSPITVAVDQSFKYILRWTQL